MECLYCEAPLKPFRGFFDEDFCCREHRDKYLASFRKGLSRLPQFETPDTPQVAETAADVIAAPLEMAEGVLDEIAAPPYQPEAVADVIASLPYLAEAVADPITAEPPHVKADAPGAPESLGVIELEVHVDEEPVFISGEEDCALEPWVADFAETALTMGSGAESPRFGGTEAFPCHAIKVSRFDAVLQTAFHTAQQQAMRIEPVDMRGAISVPEMLQAAAPHRQPTAGFESRQHAPEPDRAGFLATGIAPTAGLESPRFAGTEAFPASHALELLRFASVPRIVFQAEHRPVILMEPVEVSRAISVSAAPQTATYQQPSARLVSRARSPEPGLANFLNGEMTPSVGLQPPRSTGEDPFPACSAIRVASVEAVLEADLPPAELLVTRIEPVAGIRAISLDVTPEIFAFSLARLARTQEIEIGAAALELPGLTPGEEARAATAEAFTSGDAEPLIAPAMLVMREVPASVGLAAGWSPVTATAEVTAEYQQLPDAPISASATELIHEYYALEFMPSPAAMECEEYQETRQQATAADPEVAPAMVVSSTPHDRPASLPAFSPNMLPPSLEFLPADSAPPSQLSFSFHAPDEVQDPVADLPHGLDSAAKTSSGPHAHDPLQPAFGSSVKIKNWRLRITFAKPA